MWRGEGERDGLLYVCVGGGGREGWPTVCMGGGGGGRDGILCVHVSVHSFVHTCKSTQVWACLHTHPCEQACDVNACVNNVYALGSYKDSL